MSGPVQVAYWVSLVQVPVERAQDRYSLHRLFWRAFPDDTGPQPFLFSRQPARALDPRLALFWVQSPRPPQWTRVAEITLIDTKAVRLGVASGQGFLFQLQAAPLRAERPDYDGHRPQGRGRKLPLTRRPDILDWFERRAAAAGFEPLQYVFTLNRECVALPEPGKTFTLTACQFDGRLRVLDPAAFARTVLAGFGPKKAFGFGLLRLARAG